MKISHKKKMIAPIIVALVMILYYLVYFGFLLSLLEGLLWKIALGIIPLAMSAVMIAVCVERIKEIQGGEEDDLSQY